MRIRGFAPATPCWAQLSTPDPASVTGFYEGLFGWKANTTDVGITVFTLRDLAVAGVAQGHADLPPHWQAFVATDDVAATTDAVAAAGGTVLQPPTPLGEHGRLSLVVDQEGALFGLWQRGNFQGAQLLSEEHTVSWHELASRDLGRAREFYGTVLHWTDQDPVFATGFEYREWYADHRSVAGLLPMAGQLPDDVPPHWRITIETHDCAATVARCESLGGQVHIGPVDVGVGWFAQLADPAGGSLGVVELLPELRVTL